MPGDRVTVDKKVINIGKEKFVYLAFNKPKGIVCTTDVKREKNNIIDYLNYPKRIFPIGRLDKPSQGLIFLTSDGDIVNKILRASNYHEKEYLVTVDKSISKEFVQKMSSGLPILGTITKKCEVEKIANKKFKIVLTQGLNRQIRRMCEYLNYEVKQLKASPYYEYQFRHKRRGVALLYRKRTKRDASNFKKIYQNSTLKQSSCGLNF